MTAVHIEALLPEHAEQVLGIYQAGIDEGNATFETQAPDRAAFDKAKLPGHRFVVLDDGAVLGRVAASAVSDRCAYAGVVEHSVYVRPEARGRGVARALLDALVAPTEAAGFGPSSPGSSPRTPPASPSTREPGSGSSAPESGTAGTTGPGGTWSCWSAGAL